MLSLPMSLIWPVDPAQFEKRLSLAVPAGEKKLRFGPMRFVWNDGHDEVMVNVPILALPEKTCRCQLNVQGLPGWHYERDNRVFATPPKGQKNPQTQVSFAITGTDRIMDVKNIRIEPVYDSNLSREYQLVVTTSMQTKPGDVLDKLDLLLLPKKASASQIVTGPSCRPCLPRIFTTAPKSRRFCCSRQMNRRRKFVCVCPMSKKNAV